MNRYLCKCGRAVNKSTNADNTGNRETEGCEGCPYLMPWGEQKYNHDTKHFYLDIKGYEYGALNTASKMQANVEIVQAFSRAADISLPLFLDNRESVTDLTLPDEMQVINLNVIPGEKLGLKGD